MAPSTLAPTPHKPKCRLATTATPAGSQKDVEKAIRELLKPIPGIETTLGEPPIYVALLGPEPTVLETEVQRLADKGVAWSGLGRQVALLSPQQRCAAADCRSAAPRGGYS